MPNMICNQEKASKYNDGLHSVSSLSLQHGLAAVLGGVASTNTLPGAR
jgi:hypothetical protein